MENVVRTAIERDMYTPQLEPILEVKKIKTTELGVFDRYHNILILGSLQSGSGLKNLFESSLSPEDLEKVKNDSLYLFRREDPWYTPQILIMMVSKDLNTLKNRITENSDYLHTLFKNHVHEVMEEQMFYRLEQVDIEKKLLENYGWMVKVQNDYFIAEEIEESNVVWLRRSNPERWLLVHWVETDDPSMLTNEWCLEKRKWIGTNVYRNERVVEGYTNFERIDFNGRYAIEVRGLWETDDYGGPFGIFAFFDEPSSRIYLIDMACFARGKTKMEYIHQLTVIAKTFRTKEELESEE